LASGFGPSLGYRRSTALCLFFLQNLLIDLFWVHPNSRQRRMVIGETLRKSNLRKRPAFASPLFWRPSEAARALFWRPSEAARAS
jgi:hypothetical protein